MTRTTLIGIDVGTTATKAVLVGAAGTLLARFVHPHATARPAAGLAEQNPDDWMAGVLGALAAFAGEHDLGGLAGIGICSQVNTHVFVDRGGRVLLPAMTWQDTRCAPDAAALDARVTAEDKTAWFGGPLPIDASHALSRIAHVRRVYPEIYAATAHVLLPKDFCALQLTGAVASDAISAVGLVNAAGYVGPLIDLVPGAAERLPPLLPFGQIIGRVKPGHPCAGTPVALGTMDAWAGMFGVGVVGNGDAMYQSGTSEIPGIVSATVNPTPGVILFPPYEEIVLHAAPTQSGGAALRWIGGVLGREPAELSAMAGSVGPSSAVPLFLPHLEGERAPIWDSATRGVFARIDSRAGGPELVRAVMEGVAFSARWAFEALQQSAGISLATANIGGGGALSDVWCQIRADALGLALRRAAVSEAGALGAAILAGLGSGVMPSLPDAVRRLVMFDRSFDPDPANRGYYDDKFGKYRELYASLKPFNAGY